MSDPLPTAAPSSAPLAPRSRRRRPGAVAAALALALLSPACSDATPVVPIPLGGPAATAPPPAAPLACPAGAAPVGWQQLTAGVVEVRLDAGDDANLAALRRDVPATLRALWPGVEVRLGEGAGPPTAPLWIWLSTADGARGLADAPPGAGYGLRRVDGGEGVGLVAAAATNVDLAHGAYALLEELGVRYFHPMHEFVPTRARPAVPAALAARRSPMTATRGLHLHLLHPTEYFDSFLRPGPASLAEARRVVDWLVKTGQNHVQWSLLAGVPWEGYREHAAAIVEYAHARGVTAGAVMQLWGGASLQGGRDLIVDQANWQAELEAGLDQVFEVPWDVVEFGLGEFSGTDPASIVTWLDRAVAYAAERAPGARVSVVNHVGNYPDLYVDYGGDPDVFFYFLPGYCDARLVNDVHTVFFYDLYRPGGMYGHPDFSGHHDFLLRQLERRPVRYLPESAYWVSADVDVPVFLPEYAYARWLDVHRLHEDIVARGLPPLDGHVLFSSGHEWGYWATDYLTARALWEPERPFEHFVAWLAGAFDGPCAAEVSEALGEYVALQSRHLFDGRIVPYLSGEDLYDDVLLTLTGKETHPLPPAFSQIAAADEGARAAFEGEALTGLRAFADASDDLHARLARACGALRGGPAAPFCDEFVDGIEITSLRARHAVALYAAALAAGRGAPAASASRLAEALAIEADAAAVVARREAAYRFAAERLTGQRPDLPLPLYKFGYLRQAHTLCLWKRRRAQAQAFVEGAPAPAVQGLSCVD